jgi:hypothetical protein
MFRIRLRIFRSVLAFLFLASLGQECLAAPPQAINKTISVSFTVSIPARRPDGSTMVGTRATTRQIYVSSQGRVFVRVSRRAGRRFQEREAGPSEGRNNFHFRGDRLVGVLQFRSGASQLSISIDPSGQSCQAQVIFGAEAGKPIVWKGLNGVMMTSTGKPTIGGVTCSIRSGNAFAAQ